MNNEQYQQIIDEAYRKYIMLPKELSDVVSSGEYFNGRNLSQEEFINRCKTDPEFSERWGTKIEERELSLEERSKIWNETHNPAGNIYTHNQYNENNLPTKLITLTYKDKTIESYE